MRFIVGHTDEAGKGGGNANGGDANSSDEGDNSDDIIIICPYETGCIRQDS